MNRSRSSGALGSSHLGGEGETAATEFLSARGLLFRAANVRSRFGEIDLVMEDPQSRELVFVEVKTRRGSPYGTPAESVTVRKRAKLEQLIAWYCQRFGWNGQVRLDVVEVVVRSGRDPEISHTPYVSVH